MIFQKPKLFRVTTVPVSLQILLKGQHSFMVQNGFEVIGVASKGSELYDVAQDEGISVVGLEMTRTIVPLHDLLSLWKMFWLCRKEKPTIVHSHTPKAGIIGMLGAKLAGVPIRLHTVAGLPLMEATGIKRKVLDVVEMLTYACATRVYPNSKGLYAFIIAHKLTTVEKLKIIANGSSNGIDTTYFNSDVVTTVERTTLKTNLGIGSTAFVYVFVGRLVGDKGINELVKAFTTLPFSHCKLLLVGTYEAALDPLQSQTLNEIAHHPNIIAVGFQSDIRPYLAISDCLVFPSYREGFPNVVMQAGAFGLPSIVSDINGCNEIIIAGENGLLVPVKNWKALQEAMLLLNEDPILRTHLQSNARFLIASRYDQRVVWEALLAEYHRLLAGVK